GKQLSREIMYFLVLRRLETLVLIGYFMMLQNRLELCSKLTLVMGYFDKREHAWRGYTLVSSKERRVQGGPIVDLFFPFSAFQKPVNAFVKPILGVCWPSKCLWLREGGTMLRVGQKVSRGFELFPASRAGRFEVASDKMLPIRDRLLETRLITLRGS